MGAVQGGPSGVRVGKLIAVLLYTIEQGEVEQRIIRQCMKMRKPLPKKIQNAPELNLGLELYWDAFWDLSTCRPTGFGAGPIPWLAVRDYSLTFEFDDEQQDDLFHLIRLMDNEYINHYAKKESGKGSWQRPGTSENSQKGWSS